MIDKDDLVTGAYIGGSLVALVTIGDILYGIFSAEMGTNAAAAMSIVGIVIFGITVLTVNNRVKIKNMQEGE